MVLKIISGVLGVVYGIYLMHLRFQKHKRIDSQGIATVKEVRKLGREDGKKSYAIFYNVEPDEENASENSFELCKTPTHKHENIGKTKTIYFEKNNPKRNFYFKSIGRFDHRLILPVVLLICSVALWLNVILQLF